MKRHFKYGFLSGSILLILQFIITKIMEINIPFLYQFIIFALILVVVNIVIFYLLRDKKTINIGTALKDIGKCKTDSECALWDYGKYGYSAIPLNDTWQQWISSGNGKYGLVITVNRPDLDYYNFGDEFYFIDLKTNKEISIPTGNRARNEQVGNLFHNGMVVRLMPRTT